MSLIEILKRNPNLTLKDFQELQKEYDERFVNQKFATSFDKVRHTYEHMGKLLGKLATYVEAIEGGEEASAEDIKIKVIPDLLVFSAWLAEEFGVDVEQAYLMRFVENLNRLYKDKISPQELEEIERYIKEKFK